LDHDQGVAADGQLDRVAAALRLGDETEGPPPRVLFWGAPAEGADGRAVEYAGIVEQISRNLGENPRRRSEPT
jgi:hypothetical protein